MPAATCLQGPCTGSEQRPLPSPKSRITDNPPFDLQTPSSPLRQHLDPEALPRPDYFDSLDDLHFWYQLQYGNALRDELEPCSKHTESPWRRRKPYKPCSSPKLVVCHDFQGGYKEEPHQQGYSLEHMHLVDTFIYFSHKRVSIPPVGWLAAASRTGTKVLGTLIFEWKESVPDLAQLLRGPERKSMPVLKEPFFSPQYALELIELALARGFSGYLVNIEVTLDLGFSCSGEEWPAWVGEQARVVELHRNAERLRGWLHFLRDEGTKRFVAAGKDADEWEIMWYDSIVYPHGQLAWQDALNQHNIDYFKSAHSFFTNYTWARPPQPLPPGQLIDPNDLSPQALQLRGFGLTGNDDGGFHPQLLLSAAMADSVDRSRSDVYVGVDVFGRNCWGGLKSWKSLDMIKPRASPLNLSVALFAPGWTWEEESAGLALQPAQAARKRNWSDWWHIDLAFWIGIPHPSASTPYRITLDEKDVKPIHAYFGNRSYYRARDRRLVSPYGFYTNFAFGSGTKWFDRGELVHNWGADSGFTDIGVCMPKPDSFFNQWHVDKHLKLMAREEGKVLPPDIPTWRYDHERVWAGNASFLLEVAPDSTLGEDSVLPPQLALCSAAIETPEGDDGDRTHWEYTVVYDAPDHIEAAIYFGPSVRKGIFRGLSSGCVHKELGNGWKAVTQRYELRDLGNEREDAMPFTSPFTWNLLLCVRARLSRKHGGRLRIGALHLSRVWLNANSSVSMLSVKPVTLPSSLPSNKEQGTKLQSSVLTWAAPPNAILSMYYNIWVQAVNKPETKVWLGTSTREATPFEFCLPDNLDLPNHLVGAGELEFVVTSLDAPEAREVAKGPAIILSSS